MGDCWCFTARKDWRWWICKLEMRERSACCIFQSAGLFSGHLQSCLLSFNFLEKLSIHKPTHRRRLKPLLLLKIVAWRQLESWLLNNESQSKPRRSKRRHWQTKSLLQKETVRACRWLEWCSQPSRKDFGNFILSKCTLESIWQWGRG